MLQVFYVGMVLQVFYVYARGPGVRVRTFDRKFNKRSKRHVAADIHKEWAPLVLRDLQHCDLRPNDMDDNAALDPIAWNGGTTALHNKVIGVILAKPVHSATTMDILSERARFLKDYYDLTWEYNGNLLFFKVVAAVPLQVPVSVYARNSVR